MNLMQYNYINMCYFKLKVIFSSNDVQMKYAASASGLVIDSISLYFSQISYNSLNFPRISRISLRRPTFRRFRPQKEISLKVETLVQVLHKTLCVCVCVCVCMGGGGCFRGHTHKIISGKCGMLKKWGYPQIKQSRGSMHAIGCPLALLESSVFSPVPGRKSYLL